MKRGIQIFVGAIALFGATLVANKVRFRYDWENAYWRTLMTPMTGTVWTKGFSEDSFAKVSHGMQSSEVLALLGEPLRKNCDQDGCFWPYTGQDTDTADSDRRWIVFNAKDRVVEIVHEFHID
jgi:hypothetical protein